MSAKIEVAAKRVMARDDRMDAVFKVGMGLV
jgi:hypothetical protein